MIHGVDPSRAFVGYATLDPAPGHTVPALELLEAIRLPDEEPAKLERLRDHLSLRVYEADRGDRFIIEKPPPAARQDTGHGWQAAIGDGVGFIGGTIAGMVLSCGFDQVPVRVTPGPWRAHMLTLTATWGRPIPNPKERLAAMKAKPASVGKVERDPDHPGGFRLRWADCDHVWPARDLAHLQRKPEQCPECGHETASRADRMTDLWKQTAVDFVAAWWPEQLEGLVAAARARARKKDQPRHRLQGVADACEAAGIACYGVQL